MGKNIGIKLADGSFYPIMEDGVPKRKLLELTTVQDNQTTVTIDLYRSSDDTMENAEYVDTMQISGLVPHQGGEPNINLSLQLDENNVLSAEMSDAESGSTSNTSVDMVSLPVEQRQAAPDFTLSEVSDITADDELAFADDAFPAEFPDTIPAEQIDNPPSSEEIPENIEVSELTEDVSMEQNDSLQDLDPIPSDSLNEEVIDPISTDSENPLEESFTDSLTEPEPIMDEVPVSDPETELGFDEPSTEDATISEDNAFADLPEFPEDDILGEQDSFEAPADTVSSSDLSFDEPSTEDATISEDNAFADLPEFPEDDTLGEQDSFEAPADTVSSSDLSFDEPSTEDATMSEDNTFADLPEFPEDDILNEQDSFEAPADTVSSSDSSFDEPSTEDATMSEDNAFADLPEFPEDDILGEQDSFEAPADIVSSSNSSFDEPSTEDATMSEDNTFADLPEFPEDDILDEQDSFAELPDFDGLYDDQDLADEDSLEDSEDEYPSVYESSLPDFNKFELPDFDDPVQNVGFNSGYDSGLFNESDFDDPAFQEKPIQGAGGEIDFSGLYDEPQEDAYPSEPEKKHRNTGAVITCVICAIICLASLLFILFFLPTQISIDVSRKTPDEQNINAIAEETPEPVAQQKIEELPPQPEPKEDVIVIAETPAVVPVPPPEPEKKPEPVQYKIKWGDTLWDLADSYYNNPWFYNKIAEANGITNPDHIVSGTYITIPPK